MHYDIATVAAPALMTEHKPQIDCPDDSEVLIDWASRDKPNLHQGCEHLTSSRNYSLNTLSS